MTTPDWIVAIVILGVYVLGFAQGCTLGGDGRGKPS